MKIKSIHIFLGLLAILAVSCIIGRNYIEGMTSGQYTASLSASSGDKDSAVSGSASSGSLGEKTQQRQALRSEFDAALKAVQPPPDGDLEMLEELSGSQISRKVKGPRGEDILATPQNTVQGIPRNKIPKGQEDLYILKSEIVPPVCPACPTSAVCPREEPCPPCPACERCPEPAFECKKVPNYRVAGSGYLPQPVLTDFSQFGM